jgi:hypothetical protein
MKHENMFILTGAKKVKNSFNSSSWDFSLKNEYCKG